MIVALVLGLTVLVAPARVEQTDAVDTGHGFTRDPGVSVVVVAIAEALEIGDEIQPLRDREAVGEARQ